MNSFEIFQMLVLCSRKANSQNHSTFPPELLGIIYYYYSLINEKKLYKKHLLKLASYVEKKDTQSFKTFLKFIEKGLTLRYPNFKESKKQCGNFVCKHMRLIDMMHRKAAAAGAIEIIDFLIKRPDGGRRFDIFVYDDGADIYYYTETLHPFEELDSFNSYDSTGFCVADYIREDYEFFLSSSNR